MLRMKSRNLNTFTACASIRNCGYCTSLGRQNGLRCDVCPPRRAAWIMM